MGTLIAIVAGCVLVEIVVTLLGLRETGHD